MKQCSNCKVEQPDGAFYKRADRLGALHSWCIKCMIELRRSRNPEIAEYQRKHRAGRDEEAKKADKDYQLWYKFNITLDDYNALLEEQGGVCAVCKKPPTKDNSRGTLAVDHDHLTGTYRGLLCTNCNTGIGSFFDDPTLLENAAEYLKEYRALVISILEQKSKVEKIQTELVASMLDEIEKL